MTGYTAEITTASNGGFILGPGIAMEWVVCDKLL